MRHLSKLATAMGAAALLIAAGGGYAIASSNGGTITVCVHHNGGALYKAHKCARHDNTLRWNEQGPVGAVGATGQQGAQGPQGPAGPGAQWALVRGSDGSVLEQSGGVTVTRSSAGNYFVGFPSTTASKLLLATAQWQTTDANRTAQVARCGGTTSSGASVHCLFGNDSNHVYVETWQGTTEADVNFYVSAIG
jgi:hypothetical protein